jgi:pimeloyl-ACP methyl ester carboxylesterase
LVPELRARGHEVAAVDLPGDDEVAGLPEYADLVEEAIDGRRDAIVVAQSLGGFSAAMACARSRARSLVLLNAMIPLPHETPGEWFAVTGAEEARRRASEAGGYSDEFDVQTYFLHDVPDSVVAEGESYAREEADVVFGQLCDIEEWPDVPTRVLAAENDRFFPPGFQARVARERIETDVETVPGGHLVALSRPFELAERLGGYAAER